MVADEIFHTPLTNKKQRNYWTHAKELETAKSNLASCWCTAVLCRLNIGQLQEPASVPPAKLKITTDQNRDTLNKQDTSTKQLYNHRC
jgi:hypothetical protein